MLPGWTASKEASEWVERVAQDAGTDYPGGVQIIMDSLGGILLGRSAKPEGIANPVAFWLRIVWAITGTEYVIDGGTIPTA